MLFNLPGIIEDKHIFAFYHFAAYYSADYDQPNLSQWQTMESPTQLCWRYHSLPLRQLYEVTPKMIYSNVSLVTFCTLLASRIRNYPKEYNSILGPTAKPLSRPLEMLTESPAGPLACGRTLSDNDCNHRLKKACDRTQPIIAVIYVILIFVKFFIK